MSLVEARPGPATRRFRLRRSPLWGNPGFLRLWCSETVSLVGDQVSLLAFPLIAVLTLQATPAQVGGLTAAAWAPSVISPAMGTWIDRRDRHREMMIAADLGRAALLVTVPVAAALDLLTIAQLYVVAFGLGILSEFFYLAHMSYFPALVQPRDMVDAQAKLNLSRATAEMGGPGFGGVLVQALTAPFAVVADALSFVASAGFLARITVKGLPVSGDDHEHGTARRMAEGFRFLFSQPVLRASLFSAATLNFFNFVMWGILVLYASRTLGLSPGLIGAAFSAGAIGALLGAMAAPRLGRRWGLGPVTIAGAVLFTVPMALIPLAHGPAWRAATYLLLSEVVASFGVVLFDINLGAVKLVLTPQRVRARSNGAFRAVNYGTRPLGALLGGFLGGAIGLRPTLWIAVAGGCTAFLWLLFSPIRHIRDLPPSVDREI